MLKIKMSPLSDVLSRLSDEINMQEDLSMRCVPINRSSRLSESPLSGDYSKLTVFAILSGMWLPHGSY